MIAVIKVDIMIVFIFYFYKNNEKPPIFQEKKRGKRKNYELEKKNRHLKKLYVIPNPT